MKIIFIILFTLVVIFIVLLLSLQKNSGTGEATGLIEGMLSKCPDKPNCVCSEYRDDIKHHIDSIIIPKNNNINIFALLTNIIQEMGGHIQVEHSHYLAATFTSSIFKFIDDLEIRIDSTHKVIHIRSASRVGYSDMGVNKKRVALLKKLFNTKILETGN